MLTLMRPVLVSTIKGVHYRGATTLTVNSEHYHFGLPTAYLQAVWNWNIANMYMA